MLGLAFVAVATAWAGAGSDIAGNAVAALKAVPAVVVLAGVALLLRTAVPRGALAGPVVLIIAGLVALAIQHGLLGMRALGHIGPAILFMGGIMTALSRDASGPPLPPFVVRPWSVFLHVTRTVRGNTARKYVLRCVLGRLRLDLSGASYPPDASRITIDVTLVGGGRIELDVPEDWTVRAGRLHLARGIAFSGLLSDARPIADVPEENEFGQSLVVLNVQGWLGTVAVRRVQSAGPPPASAPAGPVPA